MNLANQLTVVRILLVPVFIGLLLYYSPEKSFFKTAIIFVFLSACITDAMDGYAARRLNQKTTLGSYIDPLADKLLLLGGFLSLSFMTHLPDLMRVPAWVTISVITRDAVILIGSVMIFATTGKLKAEPLFIGKLTTVFQMLTLFVALLGISTPFHSLLYFSTVILTIVSGIQYLRLGARLLQPF